MDIIFNNISNVNTTKTNSGGPYRRQLPVFEAVFNRELESQEKANRGESFNGKGVRVKQIVEDEVNSRLFMIQITLTPMKMDMCTCLM